MAAEFAASAAANAVGNLTTEYASPYVSYFFRFGKIVEEFKNRRKELELKSDRVKNDVEEAIRQNEVIEEDVQHWRKRAEKELEETQCLEAQIERMKCFNWCPSWGWRYCLSKKVAKKTISIDKLLVSCNFPRVGHRKPPEGIEFFPSKDFMPNESSNFTFNEIIKALNTDGVNMIGLYGMPGVGKTTLAKEVGRHAKEQNLFDKVVMATMSQTPNINKIQDKIAELLGLKFEVSTEEGKAEELWRRLQGVEKILVIIDDVWNQFKLRAVGIPFGVEHEGCKVLLTTRLQQVCDRMNCQQKFQLDILSEGEAWTLLEDTAGLKDVSSRLKDVAKEVASECMGLPLAIVTIGNALKGASLDGWQAANKRLKDSRHLDNEEVSEDIYNCLKLSYDYLKGDNIRTCFLLCSLFPEDWNIKIEELVMLAIGHGLFSHIFFIEDLRREIREVLRNLQKSGLLLRTDDDGDERYVSMHDVVRDFAHWITSTGKNIFMVKEGLMEWPPSESCGSHTAISFWNSNINIFPEKLEFPELKILIFTGKTLVKVPIAFVEGMKALRVLRLENVIFSLEVLKLVTNLRTLCLVKCRLENISSLGNMKNLEILAFSGTNIYELPEELAALRGLKSLHFFYSGREQINFPPNLLSRLTSLQELYVICENNVDLSELNSLSCLTVLSLRVSTAQCFPENFVFPKLQSYIIVVNEYVPFMRGPNCRALEIVDSTSLSACNKLFCNVEKLALENVMGHKNIVPNVHPEGLQSLKNATIRKCSELKSIFPPCLSQSLLHLQKLEISECDRLEQVFDFPQEVGELLNASLQSLKNATIRKCSELKSIFPPCLAQSLLHLQDLEISECDRLEQVFDFPPQEVGELEVRPLSNLTSLELKSLPELKWIWKGPTHLVNLQSLKTLNIRGCEQLVYLFSTPLAQSLVHLQELEISRCDRLEQVFDFPQEVGELEVQLLSNLTSLKLESLSELKWIWKGPIHLVNLQSLKTLNIRWCMQLAYLFSTPLAQSLVHLQELEISWCNRLEQVFDFPQEVGELEVQLLSNLTSLKLESLSELKWIWKGPIHLVNLQSLKTLNIRWCNQLAYLFSTPLAQSLVHLQKLEISWCDRLEQVFDFPPQEVGELEVRPLSNLTFLRLDSLPKLKWIWKGPTHLVNLQSLNIWRCAQLTYLFSTPLARSLEHLEVLEIGNCDSLEHLIFDEAENEDQIVSNMDGHLLHWPKLSTLKIIDCGRLNYVFPITLAQGLPYLESVEITDCSQLKQVFNMKKDKGGRLLQDIVLQRLQILRLKNLEMLSSFCPENFVMSLSLKEFEVHSCPQLTDLKTLQAHLKDFKELLCNVRILTMDGIMYHKNLIPSVDPQGLNELTFLTLRDEKELECLVDTTDQGHVSTVPLLPNLTSLELELLPELKWICKGPNHSVCLQSLKVAVISRCNKLKYLFSPSLVQSLVMLEQLKIEYCDELEHIATELEIDDNIESDGGLLHPPPLPKLTSLEIHGCPRLQYVFNVAKENNGVDNAILPPSLEKLTIVVCPRFAKFIIQQVVHKRLQLKELRCSELEQDNLCDTINWENIFQIQDGHLLLRIEILNLQGIHQLQGPIQVASLPCLKDLKVSNCNELKSLFSSLLARNLPQLKILNIEYCEKLEEIIEMDQTSLASSSRGHLQTISFPSLQDIRISGCSNLKSLFPISVARSFANLERIKIKGPSKLEQVFGYQGELDIEDDQKGIVLSQLEIVDLSELSDLKSFAPTGCHFRFPSMWSFKITKSPKLTTSVIMDSKHPVPAITEEPQQVQNNTTEGFTTMEEIVDNQSTCNDIFWDGLKDQIPLYMTLGETRIMLR
ncbi:putative disease resistance protein At3g14460 isoform X2 [Durio zibethinus]|uniref:Disease resistance protein At3g14460 isoform X2 n=1 Tax=Durio zibethinus TaxID=66656 RepID=A0A6P5XZC7_DURZI|nr:putative disease resistance protein At3g14460 isoform X2 [Durio zibethinus]